MFLETPRLCLRPFTLDDAEDYLRLNADPNLMRYIGRPALTSLDQAIAMLKAAPLRDYQQTGLGRLACIDKFSGKMVGFAGLKLVAELQEYDIGYRFLPAYWGKGLATEAGTALLQYGREVRGLNRIVGIVDPDNKSSIAVLKKLGLCYEKPVHLSFTQTTLALYA